NIDTLNTLSQEDFISGLAEVIKYCIIEDRVLLDYLHDNQSAVVKRDMGVLTHIIKRSVGIKMDIVAKDEREGGLRQILNFGHTFGHAIESAVDFTLPHGHCVALGMVCALDYSVRNLGLDLAEAEFAISLIKSYGLPCGGGHIPPSIMADQIYNLMLRDKKTKQGQLTIICTRKLGTAEIIDNPPKSQILKSIERIL
ncbi:MAG: 3-dehydroquinate synthase, partial [Defluviitaleaceae bacterium]|nr:3-dehydroquinate synthase [Defluviitaleaceae bacterium]